MRHTDSKNHYNIDDMVESITTRGKKYFQELKNAKILLTGGTGFFGIWLLTIFRHLYEINEFHGRIYLITRNRSIFLDLNPHFKNCEFLKIIQGDIKTVVLGDIEPDHLIHLASTSASETFNDIEQIEKIDTLYLGTKNILDQCGQFLQKVLFTSSGAAYGSPVSSQKIGENSLSRLSPHDDRFALCLGKNVAEFQVRHYAEKLNYDYSIARCFSFAGELMPLSMHYAFGNFIGNAMKREDIILTGTGTAIRSYMYIGDAILWFIVLLTKPKNDVFNVGSDSGISVRDLAELIGKQSSSRVKSRSIDVSEGNFERTMYVPCLKKVRAAYPDLDCWIGVADIVNRMFMNSPNHNISTGEKI